MAKDEKEEAKAGDEKQIEEEKVDFEKEIEAYVANQEMSQNSIDFIRKVQNAYEKGPRYTDLNLMVRMLLDKEDNELKAVPTLSENVEERNLQVLGIAVQNAFDNKNSNRVTKVQEGKYVTINSFEDARNYLNQLKSRELLQVLKGKESTLIKKY